jgi:YjbE family integral membrane protein
MWRGVVFVVNSTLLPLLSSIGSIIFVDLILSGDNALVIGAAVAELPRRQRWLALILGGGGAIFLRILFTSFATFIITIRYLQIVGGVFVLFIAIQLLTGQTESQSVDEGEPVPHEAAASVERGLFARLGRVVASMQVSLQKRNTGKLRRFFMPIATIIVADVTTSLDNIIAVGALARGQVMILVIGLVLSIVFLLVSSALVAELINRFPWLIPISGIILIVVAAQLIVDDVERLDLLHAFAGLYQNSWDRIIIYVLSFAVAAGFVIWSRRRNPKVKTQNS